MSALFRFASAAPRDPAVEGWFAAGDPVRLMARPWLERLRAAGPEVRELMHDGRPTLTVEDAAFAYVGAYRSHASIGFFFGAELADPAGLLEGAGKRGRHAKLVWGEAANEAALAALIAAAYADMRARLDAEEGGEGPWPMI